MVDTLALENVFNNVIAQFAADGTLASNYFGWRQSAQQRAVTNRIIWIPGSESGSLGEVISAKQPGRLPSRPLATLDEIFTVEITGINDRTDPTNELAQYKATRLLYDAWYRAVYLVARGTFRLRGQAWVIDKKEIRALATIRALCTIESMIPDSPAELAPADTRGVVEVDELDHAESFETAPAPPTVRAVATSDVALTGEQTIDTVALIAGDLVLIAGNTDPTENGPYEISAGAWTRTADVLVHNYFFHVDLGAVNGDSGWALTTDDPIVVGTTPLTFVRVSP